MANGVVVRCPSLLDLFAELREEEREEREGGEAEKRQADSEVEAVLECSGGQIGAHGHSLTIRHRPEIRHSVEVCFIIHDI